MNCGACGTTAPATCASRSSDAIAGGPSIETVVSLARMSLVFRSVDDASQTVSDIIAAGILTGAMEMMDQLITQAVEDAYQFGFPRDAGAVLIVGGLLLTRYAVEPAEA